MDILQDNIVFASLAIFFTLLFLLELRSFQKILPSLVTCILRWKGNLDLEDSLQLSRSRNLVAMTLAIPSCMLAYSYSLVNPDIFKGLSPELQLGAVSGVVLIYVLMRTFLNWQLEMQHYGTKLFTAANRSFYTYSIILFFLVFAVGAVTKALTGSMETARTVLLWTIAASYVVYIIRRGQIFMATCNPFATFLYLCALEILPTAVLVAAIKLL